MAIVNIQDLGLRAVIIPDGAAAKIVSTLKFPDGTTQITAAGASQWVASGNDIYNANSGKSGVGTMTPANKLDVYASTVEDGIRVGGNQSPVMKFMTNSGDVNTRSWQFCINQETVGDFNWRRSASNTSDPNAGTTLLHINSDGTFKLAAYGAGTATFAADGTISSVSDETWKTKDGRPLDPIKMLMALLPGYWRFNDKAPVHFGRTRQLGFYAQNVNRAIGEEAAPTPRELFDSRKRSLGTPPWGYYDRSILAVNVLVTQDHEARLAKLEAAAYAARA